ncbi:hypothetical protein G7046_g1624 [Stylonectria norvegica]|nr:hypothetical protein G7046_g1624 [Stylonectria norvegica]
MTSQGRAELERRSPTTSSSWRQRRRRRGRPRMLAWHWQWRRGGQRTADRRAPATNGTNSITRPLSICPSSKAFPSRRRRALSFDAGLRGGGPVVLSVRGPCFLLAKPNAGAWKSSSSEPSTSLNEFQSRQTPGGQQACGPGPRPLASAAHQVRMLLEQKIPERAALGPCRLPWAGATDDWDSLPDATVTEADVEGGGGDGSPEVNCCGLDGCDAWMVVVMAMHWSAGRRPGARCTSTCPYAGWGGYQQTPGGKRTSATLNTPVRPPTVATLGRDSETRRIHVHVRRLETSECPRSKLQHALLRYSNPERPPRVSSRSPLHLRIVALPRLDSPTSWNGCRLSILASAGTIRWKLSSSYQVAGESPTVDAAVRLVAACCTTRRHHDINSCRQTEWLELENIYQPGLHL